MDSCHIANYTLTASTQVPNGNYRVPPHHRRIEWPTAGVSRGCSLRFRKCCRRGNQYHEQRILGAAEFLGLPPRKRRAGSGKGDIVVMVLGRFHIGYEAHGFHILTGKQGFL
jgi:hypothetical protein